MTAWTESEDEELRRLWSAGYSAGDIEKRLLGRSRNAILGRIDRIRRAKGRESPFDPNINYALSVEAQKRADQRSLYILQRRDWDKASFAAIADELGLSYDTVQREYAEIMRALAQSEAA